jgi:glutathione synthase/RimK-type ligase-like ATP-grasp enzyme
MPDIYPVSDILGVLVCERPGNPPFAESNFLRKLIRYGNQAGLKVFAFDPGTWQASDNTVLGWTLTQEEHWRQDRYPVPEWVYDRAWPQDEDAGWRFRLNLNQLAASCKIRYLNGKLPDKWRVYSVLSRYDDIKPYLPPTELYQGETSLMEILEKGGKKLFLKPASGSQGRRTAAVFPGEDGTVRICGRSGRNKSVSLLLPNARQAARTLHRWIGHRTYIMQPFLELTGPSGEPFDIRVLVQKNGRGLWAVTGAAARCGNPGTVTANLHGGGTASPAESKLLQLYGPHRAKAIMKEIRRITIRILRRLEQHFGRFCELGLDFGLSPHGRVWFLEANSKPGRCAMAAVSNAAADKAAARPILYAKSILLRPPGRVIHEFDHL